MCGAIDFKAIRGKTLSKLRGDLLPDINPIKGLKKKASVDFDFGGQQQQFDVDHQAAVDERQRMINAVNAQTRDSAGFGQSTLLTPSDDDKRDTLRRQSTLLTDQSPLI